MGTGGEGGVEVGGLGSIDDVDYFFVHGMFSLGSSLSMKTERDLGCPWYMHEHVSYSQSWA